MFQNMQPKCFAVAKKCDSSLSCFALLGLTFVVQYNGYRYIPHLGTVLISQCSPRVQECVAIS